MQVHAEIEYQRETNDGCSWVHSDICPPCCDYEHLSDAEYRKFLHDALDEWLDNSSGTGAFYIAQDGFVQTRGQNGSQDAE